LIVLALPIEHLQDYRHLTGVYFPCAFAGGDADLEPDLDPARPVPFNHILSDHTPGRCHYRRIPVTIFPFFMGLLSGHLMLFS
jgi:hypothetical protein